VARPLRRLLIANRGEIACRVIRSARALGMQTVAVYSDADAGAPHVLQADLAVRIGPADAAQSYLSIDAILAAAEHCKADAIHPGYGFLSENAEFALASLDAGLTWVGPPPAAIAAMGDKAAAKVTMRDAGVPVVPGAEGDRAALLAAAPDLGFPLLVKAAAGGGGRGMRRVDALEDLPAALDAAGREATQAFGDGALLLERLVTDARHVEIQVLADDRGHIIHLGDRDCSIQRRHQKVVEEAPSPAVDAALRGAMGQAAVQAALTVGYVGAGTVEFLLAPDGGFYFLEMNTRLQVEHPVTELVWRLDLVEWQLRIARGEALPWQQEDLAPTGHAIEARLYAEDPDQGYLPRTGRVAAFQPPDRPSLRFDHALGTGVEVGSHYDPMLGKLVAWGPDRQAALATLDRGLADLVMLGVGTNRQWLLRLLAHPDVQAGRLTTHFLDDTALPADPLDPQTVAIAAALWLEAQGYTGPPFRNGHPLEQPLDLVIDGARHTTWVGFDPGLVITVEDQHFAVRLDQGAGPRRRVTVDGVTRTVAAVFAEGHLHVQTDHHSLGVQPWVPGAADVAGTGRATAPTSGRVVAVPVAVGDPVEVGQTLVLLEAMKLETPVKADVRGAVAELRCALDDVVATGQLLVVVAPAPAEEPP